MMFNLEKIIGFIGSLGFGVMFLFNRHKIKQQLIESTKRTFGQYSQSRVVIAEIFIWTLGILLICVAFIFLYQLLKKS